MMRDVLALIGGSVILLGLAGALGIGHFQLHYGPDKYVCTKAVKQ